MVFCNKRKGGENIDMWNVTILILIDGFLQYESRHFSIQTSNCHNPYFNRWFSAILGVFGFEKLQKVTILILIDGFLQFRFNSNGDVLDKSQSLF